ncbi:MAG: MaoC/PaaZ C-terminal domain-containing protein [Pseudomonadales bacterium]
MGITVADVEQALAQTAEPQPGSYSDRDSLLYAVAIGMGRDPLDAKELEYVCETVGSRVVPTAATVLARARRSGNAGMSLMAKMNFALMLHGEQRLTVHQPLPAAAEILVGGRTTGVYDKGEGKGALLTNETSVTLADGAPLFTLGSTLFFRGDGGFGGKSEGAPVPHPLPEREPDAVCEMPGRADQAMVYALCGDRNPLHRDPAFARRAGFDRPILHGLCSYGIACHAVLKTLLDYDQTRITGFDVRFSSPVYPGETQVVDMWQDEDVISFRVRIRERDVVSINNGRCTIR